jgi:hypothetical protein
MRLPAVLGRCPAVKLDAKKAVILVAMAFLAMSIWNNPAGTAENFSAFLSDVGGFLEDFWDKATEFFRGLVE